jgi:hypothetical protein
MAIPFVMINLDKPRKLRFGMGAMVQFEQLTGIKLMSLDDEMSFDVMAKMLWVMLRQEEPDLTLEQVCDLVDEHADSVMDVTNAVSEALQVAVETKRKNAGKPKA